jgi:hypothetical protein
MDLRIVMDLTDALRFAGELARAPENNAEVTESVTMHCCVPALELPASLASRLSTHSNAEQLANPYRPVILVLGVCRLLQAPVLGAVCGHSGQLRPLCNRQEPFRPSPRRVSSRGSGASAARASLAVQTSGKVACTYADLHWRTSVVRSHAWTSR